MMRGLADGQGFLTVHVLEQKRIGLGLKTVGPATTPWVELIGGEVSHDLPVSIRMEQVFEPRVADVSDVKGFVLFVEQKPARGDQPVSRHLGDERRAVTL